MIDEVLKTESAIRDDLEKDLRESVGLYTIKQGPYKAVIETTDGHELMHLRGKYFQRDFAEIIHRAICYNWKYLIADRKTPTDPEKVDELLRKSSLSSLDDRYTRELLIKQQMIKEETSGRLEGFERAVRKIVWVTFEAPDLIRKKLSAISSKHVNKIVLFDGVVVGYDMRKLIIKEVEVQKNRDVLRINYESYDRERDGEIIKEYMEDVQNLLIEESDDTPTDSKILRKITTKVYGFQVDRYEIGSKVRIIGYYNFEEGRKGTKELVPYVDALTLTRLEDKKDVKLEDSEIEVLRNAAHDNPEKYLKDITDSVCPSIFENNIPKLAVLLAFVGGSQMGTSPEDMKRSNISILLVGNPGTGKSEILKWSRNLSHKSVYVDAPNASARGLLYGQEEFDKRKILRAGVMIRFKKVMLDELDKMKVNERHELNTAIEQQIAPYHKTPFDVETPINVSVVAACNPNSDRWIEGRSIMENMQPLESMIVSRCILIKMQRSANTAERFTHIVKSSGLLEDQTADDIITPYSLETLSGMITHCSKLQPMFTNDAFEQMRRYIVSFEQIEQDSLADMPADTRKEVDLIRVTTAIAKLLFKEKVDIECINMALKFYKACMESVGMKTDSPISQTNLSGGYADQDADFDLICRELCSRQNDEGLAIDTFTETEMLKKMSEREHWQDEKYRSLYWTRQKERQLFQPTPGRYKKK